MEFDLTRVARNMTRNLFGTDIVANNLANIGTTGFKRDASFTDWFIESLNDVGAQKYTDFAQGELHQTDNPLDLALASRGFFVVETQAGPAFTRTGHFTVNDQGFIQTAQGHLLIGEKGPLSVLSSNGVAGDVQITRLGEVYVDKILIDHLAVANIGDLRAMEKIGSNLYRVANDTLVTQLEPEQYDVRQGVLEGSNVQPVSEMVKMIELQRNFESTQRVARAMDEVLGRATQLGDYR
ncbi:MAG: flagellar hook-basal body protein [Fidelibacterota bacterium]|nr:MAG: flagellar hook-basal body protein [Candidatus Neomarinimicrobiota bacterium]